MLILGLENATLAVLQVYAPNEQSEYSAFLQEVEAATQLAAKAEHFILIDDFNAHVGNGAETWRGVIGRNGFSALKPNGELLLDVCCAHDISIINTFFSLRASKSTLVYSIPRCFRTKVSDGLCHGTRWERLQNKEVKESFAQVVKERFERLPINLTDVEQEWQLFKTAVTSSAAAAGGEKRLGVAADSFKRTNWWNTGEVQQAVRMKKIAFRIWFHRKDDYSRRWYLEVGRTSKLAVKVAKERLWQDFGKRLELDYRSANKTFWQTIRIGD